RDGDARLRRCRGETCMAQCKDKTGRKKESFHTFAHKASVLVPINFPAKIISERFRQDFRRVRLSHHHVMLKSLLANMVHELLQTWNFRHRAVAEGIKRIV